MVSFKIYKFRKHKGPAGDMIRRYDRQRKPEETARLYGFFSLAEQVMTQWQQRRQKHTRRLYV